MPEDRRADAIGVGEEGWGHRGLIVFSHANSYPASTYRVLFDAWRAEGYDVRAIEKYGHDPRYPVTDSWTELERHLVDFIDEQLASGARGPLYLVGHSLGGYLSLMAALRRPQTVQGVVMMDSPVLGGWKAVGWRVAKALRLQMKVTPAGVALTRRQYWRDRDEAHQHFAAKPMFQRWDPRVLQDYLDVGIEPVRDATTEDARHTLAFRRDIEAQIYAAIPHRLMARLRRERPRFPVAFIAGTQSWELRRVGLGSVRWLAGDRLSWIEGTHLYPFEQPDATAAEVLRWLGSFQR